MKKPILCFAALFAVACSAKANINEELANLLSAKFAYGMVPAKEGKIDEIDPFWNEKTSGMIFNPEKSFSLKELSFEDALKKAKIEHLTFGQHNPWTPGKQSSWVLLDAFGKPFLSLTLVEDQPELIRFKQVTDFAYGQATLGRATDRYFYGELTSKDLVQFLKKEIKERASIKFTAENLKEEKPATLPSFSVKDLTLPEAIQKLNREIREEHPGRYDLLVAYVAPTNIPEPIKKISIELTNNPPIWIIVQYLTDKSLTHYAVFDSQLTIYGWHRPDPAKEEGDSEKDQ